MQPTTTTKKMPASAAKANNTKAQSATATAAASVDPMRAFVVLAVQEVERIANLPRNASHPAVTAWLAGRKETAKKRATTAKAPGTIMAQDLMSVISACDDDTILEQIRLHTFCYWHHIVRPAEHTTLRCARALCNVFDLDNYSLEYKPLIEAVLGKETPSEEEDDGQVVIAGKIYSPPVEGTIIADDLKRIAIILSHIIKSCILYIHAKRKLQYGPDGSLRYTASVYPEINVAYWAENFHQPFALPRPPHPVAPSNK